ncbi:MAG: hypothetical protein EP343_30195 [Deltaproteobacteria bacterium]|nr:MAG: hypothetical protein EP343_30195 [Deltaproteobacteria bacterium]
MSQTVRKEDVEFPFALYPRNVDSQDDWDRYWKGKTSLGAFPWQSWKAEFASGIRLFRKRGLTSVLFVGNGVSPEPQLFAYAGFQSTSLELSRVANEQAATWSFPHHSEDSCPVCQAQETCWLSSIEEPSGKSTFVTGNVLNPYLCPGPYDALVVRRTLHLFDSQSMHEVLRRLRERLRPGGVLIAEIHRDQKAYQLLRSMVPRYQWILREEAPTESFRWTADLLLTS